MLARHDGRVVLVAGAIPGERVRAHLEHARGGAVFARVDEVLVPSADRRPPPADPSCGGLSLAHIAYSRQLEIKREIIEDALRRTGRLAPVTVPPPLASPETGYRLRARLHCGDGVLGFYREGTHKVCDPRASGQLSDGTVALVASAPSALGPAALDSVDSVIVTETLDGDRRAVHVSATRPLRDVNRLARTLMDRGASGVSVSVPDRAFRAVAGTAWVDDPLDTLGARGAAGRLRRHAHAFFQGNRFVLPDVVRAVVDAAAEAPIVDLYAGVGLFAVSLAACGREPILAVEGGRAAFTDLVSNARDFPAIEARCDAVEDVLADTPPGPAATCILDPPRTGLSAAVRRSLLSWAPRRLLYVSCDVATFARDLGDLVRGGYALEDLRSFDFYPNTAHVELLAVLDRTVA